MLRLLLDCTLCSICFASCVSAIRSREECERNSAMDTRSALWIAIQMLQLYHLNCTRQATTATAPSTPPHLYYFRPSMHLHRIYASYVCSIKKLFCFRCARNLFAHTIQPDEYSRGTANFACSARRFFYGAQREAHLLLLYTYIVYSHYLDSARALRFWPRALHFHDIYIYGTIETPRAEVEWCAVAAFVRVFVVLTFFMAASDVDDLFVSPRARVACWAQVYCARI